MDSKKCAGCLTPSPPCPVQSETLGCKFMGPKCANVRKYEEGYFWRDRTKRHIDDGRVVKNMALGCDLFQLHLGPPTRLPARFAVKPLLTKECGSDGVILHLGQHLQDLSFIDPSHPTTSTLNLLDELRSLAPHSLSPSLSLSLLSLPVALVSLSLSLSFSRSLWRFLSLPLQLSLALSQS